MESFDLTLSGPWLNQWTKCLWDFIFNIGSVLWIFSSKLLKNLWSQFRSVPVGSNSIPTRKTEIFWGVQKSIIYLPPKGGIPETYQANYLSGSITVIIPIKMYARKSLLRHRANHISISLCVCELFKIYEIEKSGACRAHWYLKG
jgi:hypothetical protein